MKSVIESISAKMIEQRLQQQFIEERPLMQEGHPLSSLYRLMGEVDELIQSDRDDPTIWEHAEMGLEAADVFNFLADYCNKRGINLGEAVAKKVAMNQQRFPADEFQTGSYSEAYHRVKEREGKRVEVVNVYNPSVTLEY